MGKPADTRGSQAPGAGRGVRLRELCAVTADLRRRIAAAAPGVPGDLQARLAAIVAGLPEAEIDARDRAPLLALLDEIGGLVGRLELEREAVRARIKALDRHRLAQLSYVGGRGRR